MDTRLKNKLSCDINSTSTPLISVTTPIYNDTTPLLNFMTSFFEKNQPTTNNNNNNNWSSFEEKKTPPRKKKRSINYASPANKKTFNDDQKVDAILRIQMMGHTKAEVARGLNVAESTLRGWFKNKKIATKAEATYKNMQISNFLAESLNYYDNGESHSSGPSDLSTTVEVTEEKHHRRHKQLKPNKLQAVTSNDGDVNFAFYLPKFVQRQRYRRSLWKNRLNDIDIFAADANVAKSEHKKKIVLNPPPCPVTTPLSDTDNDVFQNFISDYSKGKSKSFGNIEWTRELEQPLDLSVNSKANNYYHTD